MLNFFKELKTPFVYLNLELVENNLNFNPPLDEKTNFKNLKETIFEWIQMFIMRGSFISVVGDEEVCFYLFLLFSIASILLIINRLVMMK